MVIFDSIFHEIIHSTVEKKITSGNSTVAISLEQFNLLLLSLCKLCQRNCLRAFNRLNTGHIEKNLCQMRKTPGLFLNQGENLLVFFCGRCLFAGKNFQICLHDGKRSPKLMCGTGRKLLLCSECIIQTREHFIKRSSQLGNFVITVWYFQRF